MRSILKCSLTFKATLRLWVVSCLRGSEHSMNRVSTTSFIMMWFCSILLGVVETMLALIKPNSTHSGTKHISFTSITRTNRFRYGTEMLLSSDSVVCRLTKWFETSSKVVVVSRCMWSCRSIRHCLLSCHTTMDRCRMKQEWINSFTMRSTSWSKTIKLSRSSI